MFIEKEYEKFINRRGMNEVKHLITNKQENQIKDVLLRIEEIGVTKTALAQRTIPNMIKSGMDNLFVRRLSRKKKYAPKGTTKYGMILLYGRKGYDYWDDYREKQQYSNTFEYKNKKHGWTKEEFDNFNKSRAVTLENLIRKYGEYEGKRIWENYREKQRYTNTLDYFIEQYGYEKGKEKWKEINQQKANGNGNENYSLISQRLFIKLYDNLPNELKNKCYFATLNGEFLKFNEEKNCNYLYDFVIDNIKFCIEFNGDYWHCNPNFYRPFDDAPIKGNKLCALDIWNRDKIKIDFLKNLGYDVVVVWEYDFKNNEDYIVNKCLRRIYERYWAYTEL